MDLATTLGPLTLRNPILVASGTFGYAREMAGTVDFAKLGGVIPKTVTRRLRQGNTPPRTVETPCGMLNSIGLDNDGIEHFLEHHLPYLRTLPTALIVNIAGENAADFAEMAAMLAKEPGIAAVELNLSCPNVAGGVDFATDPVVTREVVSAVRRVCPLPLVAKLTPNVTNIVPIAEAAVAAGADILSLINTFVGMAIDWRRRRPILGNGHGGLSGPAIKPLALRIVWQVARQLRGSPPYVRSSPPYEGGVGGVGVPIMGIGGIATIDDVMEFLVAGASAVQIGTANFFDPTVSTRLVSELPAALAQAGVKRVAEIVGTVRTP